MIPNLPIEINGLVIQELKPADAEELYNFMNLPEIQEFIPDRFDSVEDLQETLEWLIGNYSKEKDEIIRLSYAIRIKDGGDFVGWVTYGPLPFDEKLKEFGVAIDPRFWNLGYATLAGKRFLEWIRANITAEEIWAEVDIRNVKSQRVVEKLDFTKIKEAEVCTDGTDKTIWIYKWGG